MTRTELKYFNRIRFWSMLIVLAGALVGCSPGPSAETCAEFNSTIDHNIMEIALSEFQGETSDKSAMQQGARLAQINNRLSTITVNVLLQSQNKCQPRQNPIDPSIYSSQASSCYLARLEQMSASYGSDEEKKTNTKAKVTSVCDFKDWNLQSQK